MGPPLLPPALNLASSGAVSSSARGPRLRVARGTREGRPACFWPAGPAHPQMILVRWGDGELSSAGRGQVEGGGRLWAGAAMGREIAGLTLARRIGRVVNLPVVASDWPAILEARPIVAA